VTVQPNNILASLDGGSVVSAACTPAVSTRSQIGGGNAGQSQLIIGRVTFSRVPLAPDLLAINSLPVNVLADGVRYGGTAVGTPSTGQVYTNMVGGSGVASMMVSGNAAFVPPAQVASYVAFDMGGPVSRYMGVAVTAAGTSTGGAMSLISEGNGLLSNQCIIATPGDTTCNGSALASGLGSMHCVIGFASFVCGSWNSGTYTVPVDFVFPAVAINGTTPYFFGWQAPNIAGGSGSVVIFLPDGTLRRQVNSTVTNFAGRYQVWESYRNVPSTDNTWKFEAVGTER